MITSLAVPQSLPEFARQFHSEEACQDYILALRWPNGYLCPTCGTSTYYWHRKRRLVICPKNHQTYIVANTIMQDSKQPLLTWFYGAFLATTLTPGISAVQFQQQLGIKRYETAFQVLHKLRTAMVNPERKGLHGVVEVDETYVGGVAHGGKGGRSTESKTLVVGAVEVRERRRKRAKSHNTVLPPDKYAGRVRLRAIEDASGEVLSRFVREQIQSGTTVRTDGWGGYNGLRKAGYDHQPTVEGAPENASVILPIVHLEFSNLKTWLDGTHHGRVERKHLQAYLNEFCFRHNRRFWRFTAFQTVLRIGIGTQPMTYADLYAAKEFEQNVHNKARRTARPKGALASTG